MGIKAYVDDEVLLAKAYLSNNDDIVRKNIIEHENDFSHTIFDDGIYAYTINKNEPLSNIFRFNCYVIRFVFSCIDTLHQEKQEKKLKDLCVHLRNKISSQKGYYNIRIPSHIPDLIRIFNEVFSTSKHYFCGGTVEYVQVDSTIREFEKHPEIKLFFGNKDYLIENSNALMELAYDSFSLYQGQYHISPVTCVSAGKIYADWIDNSINKLSKDEILIAEINNNLAGYCTFNRSKKAYIGILSSVNPIYRKHGIYKSLISYLAYEAQKNDTFFCSSTQIDNYVVQKTWASLGMRPYNSFYNYHLNYLNDKDNGL